MGGGKQSREAGWAGEGCHRLPVLHKTKREGLVRR